MTTTPHKAAPIGQRHPSIDIEFVDSAERNAVTLDSTWKYRCACQLDTGACYIVLSAGASYQWVKWCDGPTVGPSGTDYAALAISNGLTVGAYYRGDFGLSGAAGSGYASWANISGAIGAITPHGSATNGIGSAGTGLNGRASLKQDGATQKGQFTAPALAVPGTTNFHKYFITKQASGGSSSPRGILQETGGVYDVYMSTGTVMNASGTGPVTPQNITQDVWQRTRISWTGGAGCELKIGSSAAVTGSGVNTAPNTARLFGDLLSNWEWLMYLELYGPKANFLTFAAAADTASQDDWTSAVQI